jgi:uncharacterized membrane protein HdeD (DUF308 family)
VAHRRGYWLAVLALGFVTLLLWPLQIVVAAVVLGSAWLIDNSLRDVVPGHARTVRRALAPLPWVLVALAAMATFLWPFATTGVALLFLGVATVLYLCCEAVVMYRDR